MILNIEIDQFSLVLNIVIRLITAVVFLTFILPLQFREAMVRNGLRKLRYELLGVGFIIFFVNTVGLSIIVLRNFFGESVVKPATDVVSLINSLGFLFIAIVEYQVYHYNYTPEKKKLHEKFDRMEAAVDKKKGIK